MTPPTSPAPAAARAGTATVTVHVNDKARTIAAAASIADLVSELGLAERKGVAIAIDNVVVPRANWPAQTLREGDRVLVIRATQGG